MQKILTISIAAYNIEKYIRKTLESLIIDNMDLLEVLIIVDGSTDRTLEIAQEYEKRFPETFKTIYKENGGYGSTINKGIKLAKGKYFKQLDGDDWYNTYNLNKLCLELCSVNDDIVYTPYIEYYEKNNIEILKSKNIVKYKENNNLEDVIMYSEGQLRMHSLAYKTELLKNFNIKIEEHCFYTDTEYALYPIYFAHTIKIFDFPIYIYRIGIEGQSISYDSRVKNYKDHLKVNYNLMDIYNNNNGNLEKNIKNYIENYMIGQFNGSILNFLLLLDVNNNNFSLINEFNKTIMNFNIGIYKKMKYKSKNIILLRTHSYILYVLAHYIQKRKFKKQG